MPNPRWVYYRMLALYPAELRREYGSEMTAQFLEELRDARKRGNRAVLGYWVRTTLDWAGSAAGAHMEILRSDLFAMRGNLSRHPWSLAALVVLLSAVLAINATGITIAGRIMVRPLPFESRGRVAFLAEWREAGSLAWLNAPVSFAQDLKSSGSIAETAFINGARTANIGGTARQICFVSASLFDVLNMIPAAGHAFGEGETAVAVLGPRLWNARYRASESAIGQTIQIEGRAYRIVGAMAEQSDLPFDPDVWLPSSANVSSYGAVLARLKAGTSIRTAQDEWNALRGTLPGNWPAEMAPLRDLWRDQVFDYIMWGGVLAFLMVLVLACADLLSFELGQAARRARDVAIRVAVGASRARIVQMAMTETMSITLTAAILSLPASAAAIRAFHRADSWGAHRLAGWNSVRFDGSVVALTIGLGILAGGVTAFIPAWNLSSRDPWPLLNAGHRAVRRPERLRSWLVGLQMGVASLILVAATTLGIEGVGRLRTPQVRYFDSTWSIRFDPRARPQVNQVRQLMERLEAEGHRTIVTSVRPFGDDPAAMQYEANGKRYTAQMARVSASFFRIPGFQWRSGQSWTEETAATKDLPPAAISMAVAQEAGLRAGDTIVMLNANGHRVPCRVAGIVEAPSLDMYSMWPSHLLFVPWRLGPLGEISLLVDGGRGGIDATLREAEPTITTYDGDFALRIRQNGGVWNGILIIWGAAAALGLSLALVGAMTWLTQIFADHGPEIALRCALGSRAGGIWRWAVRRIWIPAALGSTAALLLGTALLLVPSRLLQPKEMALAGASFVAIAGAWGFWSLILWIGSAGAAAGSTASRLRNL